MPKEPELTPEEMLGLNDPAAPAPPASLADAIAAEGGEAEERLHPLLSNEKVEELRKKARAQIMAEKVKAAEADFLMEEKARLAREEGLVTGNAVKDEPVTIHLDLAEHSTNIVLNGVPYWHGHTYTVPRHVADTLREMQSRGHDHQRQVEGKPREDLFRRPHLTTFNAKTGALKNVAQAVA